MSDKYCWRDDTSFCDRLIEEFGIGLIISTDLFIGISIMFFKWDISIGLRVKGEEDEMH